MEGSLFLKLVNATLFGPDGQSAKQVAMISASEPSAGPNGPEDWKARLPTTCEVMRLGPGIAFIDELEELLPTIVTSTSQMFLMPPFASERETPNAIQRRYGVRDIASIAISLVLTKALPGTMVGVLLPRQFMASQSRAESRAWILSVSNPRWIVEFSEVSSFLAGSYDSRFTLSLLTCQLGASTDLSVVRFVKFPKSMTADVSAQVFREIKLLKKQGGGALSCGFVYRGRLSPTEPMTYDRYDPDIVAMQRGLDHIGEVRPFEKLAKIKLGPYNEAMERSSSPDGKSDSKKASRRIVSGRDILADDTIDASEPFLIRSSLEGLSAGDICLRSINGPVQRFRVAEVSHDLLPAVATNNVIVIRLNEDVGVADRRLILAYLRSQTVVRLIQSKSSGGFHLTIFDLAQLPIPLADEELTAALASLEAAAESFRTWSEEAQVAIDPLFDSRSAQDARMNLLSTGRLVRQRREAALLVTDFSYRMRTRLPHPIAYRWRELESSVTDLRGYVRILECAETLLCYVAQLAIVAGRVIDVQFGRTHEIAKRLTNTGHGTNFGDWVAILREARDARSLKDRDDAPFYEATKFLTSTEVDAAVQRLSVARNDQGHGRGPHDHEVSGHFVQCHEDLAIVIGAAEFLSDYPLRYIENMRRDTIEKKTFYEFRELMGDHPLVPLSRDCCDASDLESGSLYTVDRSMKLHLMRPLLTRRPCPKCGDYSTFVLDRYVRKDDETILKSLEHGHPLLLRNAAFPRPDLSDGGSPCLSSTSIRRGPPSSRPSPTAIKTNRRTCAVCTIDGAGVV